MKNIWKKLQLRKMDEMEKTFALKAQRNTLIYVYVVLLGWNVYETYQGLTFGHAMNMAPLFLLVSSVTVESISNLYLQKRAVKDDDEYTEKYPFSRVIITTSFFTVMFIILVFSLILGWFIYLGK